MSEMKQNETSLPEDTAQETAEDCTHDCSSCGSSCSSRTPGKGDLYAPLNQYSSVKKVIGVISGKGGVGKSFITSYLSVLMNRQGHKTAILDADVTGPSIPKAFNLNENAKASELGILPEYSRDGIGVMSVNLLLEDKEMPVIWRGPVIAGTVKQFWTDVIWGDVDYMFVDMPPGTGDVALTVFQSIPLDGLIIVTTPQELVSMIVAKAVNMAKTMDVPILGLVENYSYTICPDCGKQFKIFGDSHIEETAAKFELPVLAKVPIVSEIAGAVDAGTVENLTGAWLSDIIPVLENLD